MHLNSPSTGHVVLESLSEAESVTLSGLIKHLIVVAVVDVVVSLPRQEDLVVMLNPVRGAVGVPVLHTQLCICHAHCLEVFLDALQTVLVGRIRQDSNVYVVIEQYLEEAVVARWL